MAEQFRVGEDIDDATPEEGHGERDGGGEEEEASGDGECLGLGSGEGDESAEIGEGGGGRIGVGGRRLDEMVLGVKLVVGSDGMLTRVDGPIRSEEDSVEFRTSNVGSVEGSGGDVGWTG